MIYSDHNNYLAVRVINILSVVVWVFVSSIAVAQEESFSPVTSSNQIGEVDSALAELLHVLDEETEIATKTKLNVDFVPGMVSVLHGKEMLARGARTVYEALSFIPGIELSASNDGQAQIIVRGVGKTFSSGKVKLLLNGVAFNATLQAAMPAILWPIDQVDRIEVIRGPGSVIYGEFASVGVINIITKKQVDQVYARRSDVGNNDGGVQTWKEVADKNISFSLSMAGQNSVGGQLDAGEDILYGTVNESVSYAPGPANTKRKNRYFILDFAYKDLNISWQYLQSGFGDNFGLANSLPSDNNRIVRVAGMQGIDISKPWQINESINTKLTLGWFEHKLRSEQHEIFSRGFRVPDLSNPPQTTTFTDGVLGGPNYEEQKIYFSYVLDYVGIKAHDLLFGVDFSHTKQGDTWAERNYSVVDLPNGASVIQPQANKKYSGEDNWLAEGLSRRVIGLYIQDQYSVTNTFNLTLGVRLDDYDDIGRDITPRIAGVFQLNDQQTLKLQYAQSFRPPTFLEMYTRNNIVVSGNPDLESEQLKSIDFGYVFNNGLLIGRATLFVYKLEGLISVDGESRSYANLADVYASGIEVEYIQQFGRSIKLDTNLSYTAAEVDVNQNIPGVAKYLSNIALMYYATPDITLNIQHRYVGDRIREEKDSRANLDGYGAIDISASLFNLIIRDFTFRFTLRNILNEKVNYPSSLVSFPSGSPPKPAYQDDYPQLGREIYFYLAYEF